MKKNRTRNEKPKVVWVGSTPIKRISETQSRELDRRIQMHKERLRNAIPRSTAGSWITSATPLKMGHCS